MTETEKKIAVEEKKKIGRPKEWTDERISGLAQRLIAWAKTHDSYALIQFCANERIHASKLADLTKESELFLEALSYAKALIASRMIKNLNSKEGGCHPAFFNKYIRLHDPLLNGFLKDLEKAETDEITKHIVKVVDFAKYKKENGAQK